MDALDAGRIRHVQGIFRVIEFERFSENAPKCTKAWSKRAIFAVTTQSPFQTLMESRRQWVAQLFIVVDLSRRARLRITGLTNT
jgi:hypothetical protein